MLESRRITVKRRIIKIFLKNKKKEETAIIKLSRKLLLGLAQPMFMQEWDQTISAQPRNSGPIRVCSILFRNKLDGGNTCSVELALTQVVQFRVSECSSAHIQPSMGNHLKKKLQFIRFQINGTQEIKKANN